jgi:hypothetical protein
MKMDNPFVVAFSMICLGPLVIFAAGIWVGRGLPGFPFALKIERRRGGVDDWEP